MMYIGNTLAVTYQELVGVMSESNVKALRHRGQLQQVQRGCAGTPALFSVDSLPERFKTKIVTMYEMPEKNSEAGNFQMIPDGGAMMFYNDYKLEDGRHLPAGKIEQLITSAMIMNAFDRMLAESDSLNTKLGQKKINRGDFWQRASQYLQTLNEEHCLPFNGRILQRKYQNYKKDGYKALIKDNWNNINSKKIKEEGEALLTMLLSHYNNLDNAQIAQYYNVEAKKNNWKEITADAVAVWRSKKDLVTSGARRGASNFYNEKAMQVKRSRPSSAFLLWSLDGWDCELLYQQTKVDKNGHNITTYTNRLVLEVVLDPCCDYIMGYAIGVQENADLIKSAIKNALQHGEQLMGEMLRTCQIQSDHFAMKSMLPIYTAVADKVTPARVKNAKSKPIERFFSYLNKNYCQHCGNWAGFGVTTDPKKQPNSDMLNINKKDFPDYEGVVEQITAMIEADRAKKRAEMVANCTRLTADHRMTMSRENYLMYFGETTGYTNRLQGCGLMPKIMGQVRAYDCFDVNFREFASEDWIVRYDPENLTNVLAVNADGSRRFMLEEKYTQPMALADRKEGDAKQLQRINQFNEDLKKHVADGLAKASEEAGKIIQLPQTKNLLGRLLLTDSDGQHKTPKKLNEKGHDDFDIF